MAEKVLVYPPQANAAFVHNMEDVLKVYRRAPDEWKAVVCVDEIGKQLVPETRVPRPRRTMLVFAAVLCDWVDVRCPQAAKVVLACDNLDTHHPNALYEAFPPVQALHAQARQWAPHRRIRVRRPGHAVPAPAHRQRSPAPGTIPGPKSTLDKANTGVLQ